MQSSIPRSSEIALVDEPTDWKPLFRLVWPMLLGQLLDMSVGLTDTWLAGRYMPEPAALSAMNLTNYVLWFLSCTFLLVGIGTTALVSRSIGAKDLNAARYWTMLSLKLGVLLMLFPAGIIVCGGATLNQVMQLSPLASDYALRYWSIILAAIPAIMIEQIAGAALRAAGDARSAMLAMVLTNVVNIFVSYWLVSGNGPFPKIGWDGLAIGSAIGYYVGAAVMLLALKYRQPFLWIAPWHVTADFAAIRQLLRIGIPGGVDVLVLIACQLGFVSVINQLGDVAAAAHGITIRMESISFLSAAPFQMAATTLVGQFLGAGKPERARRIVWSAIQWGEILVVICAGCLFLVSDFFASQFVSEDKQDIAFLAAQTLRIVCCVQPLLLLIMIFTGSLRGAGDTRWPMLITLIGFLLVRIPLAIILAWDSITLPNGHEIPLLGWGLLGAWYAMAIDIVVRTSLVTWRFLKGHWLTIKLDFHHSTD